MKLLDLDKFISEHVIERTTSLCASDLAANEDTLRARIEGRSILVIGGAGTIGSSFIKTLLPFRPSKLIVVDLSENELTELTRDLRSSDQWFMPKSYRTYPINFGSLIFEKLLWTEGPFDIVANFAAHKHVRSEKDHFSIEAMLENNVFQAQRLLDLLRVDPPRHFFCVSTDKATNPVNVMGASKKLMEEVLLAYSSEIPITTARFANVAFSNGSLLYGYIQRLLKKQPFSCPADVKRYFVSPEESGQICLLACILGESGDIFFPKIKSHKMRYFKDITDAFLNYLGYEVEVCSTEAEARSKRIENRTYPVYYFKTDTSGEKLYEEFYTDADHTDLDSFASLGIIKHAHPKSIQDVQEIINALKLVLDKPDYTKTDIVQMLQHFIPSFDHIETGKNLDQKM